MNNPRQLNYTQQLEHRLLMVKDDLAILRSFIYEQRLQEAMQRTSKLSGDEGFCTLLNIEIACDLTSDESLSWGMFL